VKYLKKEKLSIKPKIMELNDSNNIYMTLNICILSNDVNYNKAQFLDDFIDGVIDNKETYIGIPFVVNREKLESADYENLSHELKDGELLTDQIGSFVDFWKEEIEDANCLMGAIRIMKRFPNTCNAIIELYENEDLETSCEVLINSYDEVTEDGIRKIGYNEGKNSLIGSAVVTNPAEYRAKATLLVAEAYQKDIEYKEVKTMTEEKVEVFNKGFEIKYHGQLETASLKFSDVSNQIYNKLNPVNAQTSGRQYNFYIRDLYTDYVIAEDWDSYEDLYKIPYTIENDEVLISPKEQWQKGNLGFIPEGVEIDALVLAKETEISELQSQLNNAKEELETMSEAKTQEVLDLEAKIVELESKITELNELMVSEKEAKSALEGQITELNSKVEELVPFKVQVEKAEKEAKVAELSSKYSQILSEDTFKSERVQSAIQELNAVELNSVVVEEIAKEKTVEIASTKSDENITIVASKQEDLIPKSILQKYDIEA
jgi:hypothetical protein